MLITRVWHDEVPEPEHAPRPARPREVCRAASTSRRDAGTSVPSVSVVLVAESDQRRLTRALEALAAQTYAAVLLEVIVVCPSSEASVARQAAALARRR